MNKSSLILAAVAAVAVGGCAVTPTVSPSQPHGVVVLHNGVGGGDIHPALVTQIDGVNMSTDQTSFTLPPGKHTLRVLGLIKQAHLRSPAMEIPAYTRTQPRSYELELDVEEGRRYVVAAKFNGPTAHDWEPVVLRDESITR